MLWEGMTLDPKPEVNTVVCSLGKPELFMSYIWHVTTFAWLTFSCMSSQGAQWKLRFKGGFNSQDRDVSQSTDGIRVFLDSTPTSHSSES